MIGIRMNFSPLQPDINKTAIKLSARLRRGEQAFMASVTHGAVSFYWHGFENAVSKLLLKQSRGSFRA